MAENSKKYHIIYLLTNKLNGMKYVGQHSTNNLNDGYMGTGINIVKAVKEFGKHAFTKTILCYCDNKDELDKKEIEYISLYNTIEYGYNIAFGGKGKLGVKQSDEQKAKASSRMKEWNKNHPESAIKLGEYAKTRVGSLNPFYGKKLSAEHIERMRRARITAITGSNNPSARMVICIETNEIFATAKSASLKYGKTIDPCSIIKACRGRIKSAYGYHWKYAI